MAATLERFGHLDVLVNNAGYGSVGGLEELDPADLRALMETVFFGAVALTRAVVPHLRAQAGGAIVQMSSMGGQVVLPGFGAYCAAKFALEAMSEALAAEVAPFGVRVLIVEPGASAPASAAAGCTAPHRWTPTRRPSGRPARRSTAWTAPSRATAQGGRRDPVRARRAPATRAGR